MILLHDLADWSLFLVLQDHDGIDCGKSSLARALAHSSSRTSPFAQNQRASCTPTSVQSALISVRKSCSRAMARQDTELLQNPVPRATRYFAIKGIQFVFVDFATVSNDLTSAILNQVNPTHACSPCRPCRPLVGDLPYLVEVCSHCNPVILADQSLANLVSQATKQH